MKNFFASFINLDSIINAPAYYPDDLLRGADDWDVASPGTRYLGVNHKLVELLGHVHAQGLKSVSGPALTDEELRSCFVEIEMGSEIALTGSLACAQGAW